jgi:hypothetical protein
MSTEKVVTRRVYLPVLGTLIVWVDTSGPEAGAPDARSATKPPGPLTLALASCSDGCVQTQLPTLTSICFEPLLVMISGEHSDPPVSTGDAQVAASVEDVQMKATASRPTATQASLVVARRRNSTAI